MNPRINYLNRNSCTAIKVIGLLDEFTKTHKFTRRITWNYKFSEFEAFMKQRFPKFKHLGDGVHRKVWKLNNKLVIKIDLSDQSRANKNELHTSLENQKISAIPYLHYIFNGLDVLVSQKCRKDFQSLTKKQKTLFLKDYKCIYKKFPDMHEGNVGIVGNRLVAIDLGFGYKRTDSW